MNKFKIKGPIFIGRSYHEYLRMFNLDPDKLKNEKILDCAAGASSFTAWMNKKGVDVKAIDLLYDENPSFLQNRCIEHLSALLEALSDIESYFVWDYFNDLDEIKETRIKACKDFCRHYKNNREKYIKGDLTDLPFKDDTFSLVLCSHLLFIYDHRLSYDFHIKSINEMLRVSSREVRLYPLVKHKAKKSEYVNKVMNDLSEKADLRIEKVNYEFRKGACEMMRIIKW
ncbi:MAG: methyltransferase domain-containing protein [Methanobacterium sp.]